MEHTEATATQVTERYLLGELTAAEVDAFEEHYFDCAECTDDLRAGMLFMEGGRRMVRESEEPAAAPVVQIAEHRARRWQWLPAAVAAVLVLALAAPLLLQKRHGAERAPLVAVAASNAVVEGQTRAGAEEPLQTVILPTIVDVTIDHDPPPYSRYELRLIGPDGKAVHTAQLSQEAVNEPVSLMMGQGHPPGTYRLVVAGANSTGSLKPVLEQRIVVKR